MKKINWIIREFFTAYGLPEEIFSVNDPQFISEKFDMLLGLNAVKYDQVASFHEASNGALELFFSNH